MSRFKKFLPFLLLAVGVLALVVVLILTKVKGKNQKQASVQPEEETVAEIPFEKRPFVSLVPSQDGHWLKLKVEGSRPEAKSLDYEILYQLPDGRTQGVPGSVILTSDDFERDILLGSESSGKFRYDEGVKQGTLTLKFRDDQGKLVGKLSGDFELLSDVKELVSADGKFKFIPDGQTKGIFFVVMETFGVKEKPPLTDFIGPYGVFTSVDLKSGGKVEITASSQIFEFKDSWQPLTSGKASGPGVFVAAK